MAALSLVAQFTARQLQGLSRRASCDCSRLTICASAGGIQQRRRSSQSAGSLPPAAAGAAAQQPSAPAEQQQQQQQQPPASSGPLTPQARKDMVAKLTAIAKKIGWIDSKNPAQEATREQVQALQQRLGYKFRNLYLLRLALIHSSAAPNTNNSILAWIGDAALYLITAEEVGGALGYKPIGTLSEVRKVMIGRAMCEKYARHLGLDEYLVMGKSYTGVHGAASSNMVAELFEAVMGAIYLDSDLEAVRRCYLAHFPLPADPLSLLQPAEAAPGPAAEPPAADNPWE